MDGISFFVVIKEYHESIQKGYSFIENFLLSSILQIYKIYQEHNLNKKKIDFTYAAFSYLMLGIFEVTSLWSPFILFMSLLWGIAGSTIVNNTRDENRKEGINL